jgi:hypothetical protein
MIAFLMSFSGSELPLGSALDPDELPGPLSQDTHAAVGRQVTLDEINHDEPANLELISDMIALAEAGKVGIVVKGTRNDQPRGYTYMRGGTVQSDRQVEQITLDHLLAFAADGSDLTFTVVPLGTQTRIGIDRDEDGHLDRDELDACSDPADPLRIPANASIQGDFDHNGRADIIDAAWFAECMTGPGRPADDRCRCAFDLRTDAVLDLADFAEWLNRFSE